MILLIDNYDSFTYNLLHYLGELGADVVVRRNDKVTVDEVLKMKPDAIVISPGPCDPDKAGICIDLIKKAAGKIPLLGVCLGHQAIAQSFGGKIIRAEKPMHGKISKIKHTGKGIFLVFQITLKRRVTTHWWLTEKHFQAYLKLLRRLKTVL